MHENRAAQACSLLLAAIAGAQSAGQLTFMNNSLCAGRHVCLEDKDEKIEIVM